MLRHIENVDLIGKHQIICFIETPILAHIFD